jgi:hypothetical protein
MLVERSLFLFQRRALGFGQLLVFEGDLHLHELPAGIAPCSTR